MGLLIPICPLKGVLVTELASGAKLPESALNDVASDRRPDHGPGGPVKSHDHVTRTVSDQLSLPRHITGHLETMLSLAAPRKTSQGVTEIPMSGIVGCPDIIGHAAASHGVDQPIAPL
jgi:hypothetical protein